MKIDPSKSAELNLNNQIKEDLMSGGASLGLTVENLTAKTTPTVIGGIQTDDSAFTPNTNITLTFNKDGVNKKVNFNYRRLSVAGIAALKSGLPSLEDIRNPDKPATSQFTFFTYDRPSEHYPTNSVADIETAAATALGLISTEFTIARKPELDNFVNGTKGITLTAKEGSYVYVDKVDAVHSSRPDGYGEALLASGERVPFTADIINEVLTDEDHVKQLMVPPVATVPESVFAGLNVDDLEKVYIPEAVTKIERDAFGASEVSLDKVVFMKHVPEVGANVFRFSSVDTVELPTVLKSASTNAFGTINKVTVPTLTDYIKLVSGATVKGVALSKEGEGPKGTVKVLTGETTTELPVYDNAVVNAYTDPNVASMDSFEVLVKEYKNGNLENDTISSGAFGDQTTVLEKVWLTGVSTVEANTFTGGAVTEVGFDGITSLDPTSFKNSVIERVGVTSEGAIAEVKAVIKNHPAFGGTLEWFDLVTGEIYTDNTPGDPSTGGTGSDPETGGETEGEETEDQPEVLNSTGFVYSAGAIGD